VLLDELLVGRYRVLLVCLLPISGGIAAGREHAGNDYAENEQGLLHRNLRANSNI
jgi:hypothetical protein